MIEWDELRAPWPEAFSLMWRAYLAGTRNAVSAPNGCEHPG
jgi:hypothetical protein